MIARRSEAALNLEPLKRNEANVQQLVLRSYPSVEGSNVEVGREKGRILDRSFGRIDEVFGRDLGSVQRSACSVQKMEGGGIWGGGSSRRSLLGGTGVESGEKAGLLLARTSHQLSATPADMALPASLRSVNLLDVSQRIRLRGPQSQALHSEPPRLSRLESR